MMKKKGYRYAAGKEMQGDWLDMVVLWFYLGRVPKIVGRKVRLRI